MLSMTANRHPQLLVKTFLDNSTVVLFGSNLIGKKCSSKQETASEPHLRYDKELHTYFPHRTDKHKVRWKNLNKCVHSGTIMEESSQVKTSYLLNKSRDELRRLVGAITGHCTLNKHTMWMAQTVTCRHCNTMVETPLHFLTDCLVLVMKWSRYSQSYFLDSQQIKEIKLNKIWAFIKTLVY